MARESLTDLQVEQEIARLQESQYVKLANKERRVRQRRRMYLYGLRQLEKKGRELAASALRWITWIKFWLIWKRRISDGFEF